jgi:hypothetical protein
MILDPRRSSGAEPNDAGTRLMFNDARFGRGTHTLVQSPPRSLCGRRHGPLVLEPAIAQHEHAVEAIKDLFVVGHRNNGGILVQR